MKSINKIKMINKKFIIVLALAILPLFSFAQSVFDAFEDMDDVSTVVINKRAFKLLQTVAEGASDADDYVSLVSGLSSLKVFATEDSSIAAQMKSKVASYLKNTKLSELMRVKDKDANVKIYIKEGKDEDHVSELFMFVHGIKTGDDGDRKPQAVIVSITGDIDLNKISELTKELNIEGGEHLKDIKKKH